MSGLPLIGESHWQLNSENKYHIEFSSFIRWSLPIYSVSVGYVDSYVHYLGDGTDIRSKHCESE